MAKIQLNGKKILLGPKMTIYNLIKKYKLDKKKVAVEINGKIALKQNFKKIFLKDQDKIEIVHFIGGG